MERRVLFTIVLCFLVLYIWQAIFVKPAPKPLAGTPGAAVSTAATTGAPAGTLAPGGAAAATGTGVAATSTPAPVAQAATVVGDTAERDIRIETDDVIAVFTNRGARLKSWRVKHYLDQDKQPQELVETHLLSQPLPFSLRTPDEKVN